MQSLYHFTVGGAVDDTRLQTLETKRILTGRNRPSPRQRASQAKCAQRLDFFLYCVYRVQVLPLWVDSDELRRWVSFLNPAYA